MPKLARYLGVCLAIAPVWLLLVALLRLVVGDNLTVVSLLAATLLVVPNFLANKYLVWQAKDLANVHFEIMVFWVLAVLGLAAATATTFALESVFDSETGLAATAVVGLGQALGFGSVLALRYIVLDRYVFRPPNVATP